MSYIDIRLAHFKDEGTARRPGSAAAVSDGGIGMAKGTGEEEVPVQRAIGTNSASYLLSAALSQTPSKRADPIVNKVEKAPLHTVPNSREGR